MKCLLGYESFVSHVSVECIAGNGDDILVGLLCFLACESVSIIGIAVVPVSSRTVVSRDSVWTYIAACR